MGLHVLVDERGEVHRVRSHGQHRPQAWVANGRIHVGLEQILIGIRLEQRGQTAVVWMVRVRERDESGDRNILGARLRIDDPAFLHYRSGGFVMARLGRDRVGARPLYYALEGDAFAFASRPRALLVDIPDLYADPDLLNRKD